MAGWIGHVVNDKSEYIGLELLANRGAVEAVEELVFVLLLTTTKAQRKKALDRFYTCRRGEKPWPKFWKPEE